MKDLEKYFQSIIPEHMLKRGIMVLESNLKPIRILLEQRRIPDDGWDADTIKLFLKILSLMDTDKDPLAARVGEREARTASPLITELALGFCHGIGRSGVIATSQPKAPGGSIMYNLANKLATNAIQKFGVPNIKNAIVFPLATGMSLALALAAARDETNGKEVVFSRMDHKSPLKAIKLVGLTPVIVESDVFGDAVRVLPEKIEKAIKENTAAILSTTTFFPPRECDNIKAIAKIAKKYQIPHIINNAYGVQSRKIMKKIHGAIDAGRVDAIVQSTDKNFLTAIGGAIVASPNKDFLEKINQTYAGRGNAAPVVQFLAAILTLGISKYERLRDEQEANLKLLKNSLSKIADKYGERILEIENPVAVAISMNNRNPKKVGAALYTLRATGPRALTPEDWGSSYTNYKTPYLVLNAAIGSKKSDIIQIVERLDKALEQIKPTK
ncbi:MAG: O-phosphoseryl-tRNA(Sec) selenium transferase [Candidatus Helarchaeota archaeon]